MRSTGLSSILVAATVARAAVYNIADTFVGKSFLSGFDHIAIADPTHGRVNYVNQATAVSQNLTYTDSDTLILRADHQKVLSASGPGRNSVRIQSKKQYTTHVQVMNVRHMPQGCGTWPAYWTTNTANWPAGGEIDIIEGVNDQGPNAITLHTTAGCTQPGGRAMSGTPTQADCNWQVNGNAGCGVKSPTANSYGPAFNNNGGGFYVTERTKTFIKVWFWPRGSANVPAGVKNGAASIDTSGWGQPTAVFVDNSCDFNSHFGPENIIINLTFCGDWAGGVYGNSGCPGSCVDYVNNNPAAFKNAYWDIASLRVYQ
ncbi:hypothetical protein FRC12_009311 [Ceratobasidium sp. 428]|nr:hypothetical protein FRC12_009311 [Ceratobasidium sp. 428]